MSDRRPPRFAGDERETVMALWRYHRESFLRKLDGLSDEEAGRRLVGSQTTLLWLAKCEEAWRACDAIVGTHAFDDLCARLVHGDSDRLNLRWVVVHLLEETARHAGHADILRELIDGSTGR